ncbi:MAG: TonB-dependent receptor, partial [Treponema sp.]|nr:TonB-dependent receptor [Treponema sp.]
TDFNFVSKRYTSNLNNNYLEPYLLINLSAQWNQFNFIKPYIKLNNILNQDYEQTEDYPLPGISCELGIKIKW